MDEFTVIAILTVSVVVGKFVNYLHTARTKKSCKWLGIVIAFAVDVLALFTVPVPKPEVYPAGGITSYYTTDSITDPKFGKKYSGPFSIDRPRTVIAKNRFLFRWSEAIIVRMHISEDGS